MQLGAVTAFRDMMQQKLAKKPWIAENSQPHLPTSLHPSINRHSRIFSYTRFPGRVSSINTWTRIPRSARRR